MFMDIWLKKNFVKKVFRCSGKILSRAFIGQNSFGVVPNSSFAIHR
jgi:hypothetical protein